MKTKIITKLTPLNEIIELSDECKRCSKCCNHGSGYILNDEVSKIAKFLNVAEEKLKQDYLEEAEVFGRKVLKAKTENTGNKFPVTLAKAHVNKNKVPGKCVFSGANGCNIHPAKPLHCKIANCNEYGEELNQWFLLNHIVNPSNPESVRQWATHLKFNDPIPGGRLKEIIKDQEKLKEILGYRKLR